MKKDIFSVSQVNHFIASVLSDEAMLASIRVRGELSNVKYHSSGHVYFTLKDQSSVLPCAMFRSSVRQGLDFRLNDGDKVVVTGSIGVYESGGRYQLYAGSVEKEGAGELLERFEKLKKELSEEGMFSEEYKKPLPEFAMKIGVVTAPTGAVIHDIIRNAKRRNPFVSITLCPAKVQGEGAAESIADGIARLDAMGPDVIIVARGGGSMEDLWAFNEEIVARQIFFTNTPVVTGIGHEPDVTIADYVADKRASTPTAAAELTVFSYEEFERTLFGFRDGMDYYIERRLDGIRDRLGVLSDRIKKLSPERKVQDFYQRLSDARDELNDVMLRRLSDTRRRLDGVSSLPEKLIGIRLKEKRERLSRTAAVLEAHSPVKKLMSGYSYVSDGNGKSITSADDVRIGDTVDIRLYRGRLSAEIKAKSEE